MVYRAAAQDTAKLLTQAETGMGYQVFDAQIPGYSSLRRFVAYNDELIVELDGQFSTYRSQIVSKGLTMALREAIIFPGLTSSIVSVRRSLISERWTMAAAKESEKHRHKGGTGAKDNDKEAADGKETFVRISAYLNDRRVDQQRKCLLPGAYTTTGVDYLVCVQTKDDPVDRYALPNSDKPEWAFFVMPRAGDQLRRGIVQPAFNHDGGGVEALFDNGTSSGSLIDTRKYGE